MLWESFIWNPRYFLKALLNFYTWLSVAKCTLRLEGLISPSSPWANGGLYSITINRQFKICLWWEVLVGMNLSIMFRTCDNCLHSNKAYLHAVKNCHLGSTLSVIPWGRSPSNESKSIIRGAPPISGKRLISAGWWREAQGAVWEELSPYRLTVYLSMLQTLHFALGCKLAPSHKDDNDFM